MREAGAQVTDDAGNATMCAPPTAAHTQFPAGPIRTLGHILRRPILQESLDTFVTKEGLQPGGTSREHYSASICRLLESMETKVEFQCVCTLNQLMSQCI